ncbi:uncharacterized protein LOC129914939 [Episyrphus balteatus]|uniref:uncharacterized protein LOC129914939 n=1 Tax=Episyrphus balteatus TaxID=286459 RepID=UPI002485A5E2|nr:uncharacterized protein LOC129914939 [Episyrphus balteatus]
MCVATASLNATSSFAGVEKQNNNNIRTLSPELAKTAQEELGENPDRLQKDINELRSGLESQPHLISGKDDQFLETRLKRELMLFSHVNRPILSFLKPELLIDLSILDILKCGMNNIPPNPLPGNGRRLLHSSPNRYTSIR